MTNEEKEYVEGIIEVEGFDYAFCYYTSFEEIKDDKFHELRLAYINAQKALERYIR